MRLLLTLLLGLWALAPAFADTIARPSTNYFYATGFSTTTYTTCAAAAIAQNGTNTGCIANFDQGGIDGFKCAGDASNMCAVPNNVAIFINIVYGSCPPSYTASGATCTRSEASCASRAGESVGPGYFDWGTNPDVSKNTTCKGKCQMSFTGAGISARSLQGGVYHYFAKGSYALIDAPCSESDDPAPASTPAADTCGSGQTMGTINGKPQCFTSGGDPVNPNGSVPDREATTTRTSLPGGGERTSTCKADGSCVEVDTDSAGKIVAQRTKSADPLDELCQKNPASPLCTKSTFGGSCTTGFTCEGDAASCAAAKASNDLACKFQEDASKTVGALLTATGTDTSETAFNAAKTTSDLSTALSYNSRSISAHSCPSPYTVSALGATLEFSWQMFCDLASVISVFIMLGAMVLSARIVAGGVQ